MFNKNTNKYEGYIYKIFNMLNQKSYIGQTTRSINDRIREHKRDSERKPSDSPLLYQDIRDYGFNIFDVYEVEKIESNSLLELSKKLNEKEIYYIDKYKSVNPNGYNITLGGKGSLMPLRAVYKFDLNGNFVEKYDSIQDAAIKNYAHASAILACCKEERYICVGFYWCFSDVLPQSYLYHRPLKKMIVAFDSDGNFVEMFDSLRSAALAFTGDKMKFANIQNCLLGKKGQKKAYGRIWRYYDDVKDEFGNVPQKLSEDEVIYANTNKRNTLKGRSVCQFSLDGEYLMSYCTVTYASDKTGISRGSISDCLNGRRAYAGRYIWRYYDDVKEDITFIQDSCEVLK